MATGRLLALFALLSKMVSVAHADLIPTAPGPGQTFTAGGNCTIIWNVDESGQWTNVTIDLMSGSNTNMSLVTNVVLGLDGTNSSFTPYNWTCPEVDPYSAIYFYQFTNGGQTSNATWTTRFTITSPSNETVPPPNASQPNGDAIPWGVGHLLINTTLTNPNSSVDGATTTCEPANIAHLEQVNVQYLHPERESDENGRISEDNRDTLHGSDDRNLDEEEDDGDDGRGVNDGHGDDKSDGGNDGLTR
ncbi:hypothetical protein BDY19DRAFT_510831 [Irpex rosettiformis]|uniref:Uncharacterized protein n=1 Tax=Irpex rosettiformis TaxID=378272 RepID=A0ACB8UF19_9APHY|nr:hypothetical protein BDY19DRAFT_510831 [Irpex rosettiformis]